MEEADSRMWHFILGVSIVILAVHVDTTDGQSSHRTSEAYSAGENTKLTGHVNGIILGKSRLRCSVSCLENAAECHSFNYCKTTKVCELLSTKWAKYPGDLVHVDGCSYYDINAECEMATTVVYEYQYLGFASDMSNIELQVKARNDVFIGLSMQPADAMMYEIAIGGWENTKSVIRRCKQCFDKGVFVESDIVSAEEFRGFWISYDVTTGRLAVGKQGEAPFMEWVDPNPIPVKYIGFSTGWGSTGIFRYLCSI